jgi:uncharacterized protein (DUF433 family)
MDWIEGENHMLEAALINQTYIEKTPGVLGGKPRIAGKRIGVATLVDLHLNQSTPVDEIIERLPVTPSEVYAALAYYYDHQSEIDAILAEEDALIQASLDPEKQAGLAAQARKIAHQKAQSNLNEEWTASEIAEHYHLDSATVRRAAIHGDIPARKSGNVWLIRRAAAEERWGDRLDQQPAAGRPGRRR